MGFALFVLFVCVFVLFLNHDNLKKKVTYMQSSLQRNNQENLALRKEILEIKKLLDSKTSLTEEITPPVVEILPQEVEITPEIIKEVVIEDSELSFHPIDDTTTVVENTEATPIVPENIIIKATADVNKEQPVPSYEIEQNQPYEKSPASTEAPTESALSIFLKKAEKQFADNWTGILGTAIMVLGIGYLSIYTALKVAPLFRVLILWLYSGLLIGSYYMLQKKEKWVKTGLWLRSAGTSLFLFGCFGASQITALSFITNTSAGYALIGLGIALNLYIGYIIKKQTFLSLHVALSLLILCAIPEKLLISFLLAAITSTIGIALSYKEKWEYHLLVVISAFMIFDIWFNAEGTVLTATENIFAILGIIVVSSSCMLMQYRSVYTNTHFEKPAFITHLTNWILFATGLILHATGNPFKIIILFIGSIVCFLIAMQAKKKKIFWLYHLDGMVAFILLSISIILLNDWHVGVDSIACILYLVTVCCLFIVYRQKEMLLHKIFLWINHAMAVVLFVFFALVITHSLDPEKITNETITTAVITLLSLGFAVFAVAKKEFTATEKFFGTSLSVNGLLSIGLTVLLFLSCNESLGNYGNSFLYVMLAFAAIWCYLVRKFDSKTFDIGRTFFFATSIFIGIILLCIQEKSYADWTFSLGLFAVIAFNWMTKRAEPIALFFRMLGVMGGNIILLVLIEKYLSSYPLLQIFSLLGVGLLNYEFLWFHFKRKSLVSQIEKTLYVFYYIFAIIASVLFLYKSDHFSNIEIGLTCLGITAIESYVLFGRRWKNPTEEATSFANYNLLNGEFILFNVLVFGFSCLKSEFNMIFLAGVAVLAFVGFQKLAELKRYSIYSFFLLILGALLSVNLATSPAPEANGILFYSMETIALLLSVGYVYLVLKSEKEESKILVLFTPYFVNLWLIVLLFIQVELVYLPLILMTLALFNFWLTIMKKVAFNFSFAPIVGALAIVISVFYSIGNSNSFEVLDWVLQLGSVALGVVFVVLLPKNEALISFQSKGQIVLNAWLSIIMFTQLEHKWLPVYWSVLAILNVYLLFRKINDQKYTSMAYYLLANLHLAFLSFNYYKPEFLAIYILIFALLSVYIYLAYRWMPEFKFKNSLLIYPATLSIACFLYLTFDKGILTFFWVLEALGILVLGIALKEKYFRYVSLSMVGICVIRLMFFDLSNADFLIRALVLVGVGVVLIIMNSLFKKYKERFE